MSESENLKEVTVLAQQESIIQIMPFGQGSLACLTSAGRVLIPGASMGQWFQIPTPPSSTEH
jgi:hypothetical protein